MRMCMCVHMCMRMRMRMCMCMCRYCGKASDPPRHHNGLDRIDSSVRIAGRARGTAVHTQPHSRRTRSANNAARTHGARAHTVHTQRASITHMVHTQVRLYTEQTCDSCCGDCNIMKYTWSEEIFLAHCLAVAECEARLTQGTGVREARAQRTPRSVGHGSGLPRERSARHARAGNAFRLEGWLSGVLAFAGSTRGGRVSPALRQRM